MERRFGDIIRGWRTARRLSQLDLALAAGVSSRHLSFLESGRAAPSRAMTLRLATALEMPKSAANEALTAAGFAAAFPRLAYEAADMAPVRQAIALMLKNHDPYPAIAIDRCWDIVDANEPAIRLFSALGPSGNMIELLLAMAGGSTLLNWEETAFLALARLRAEIVHLGGDSRLQAMADAIADHPRLKKAEVGAVNFNQAVIPTILQLDGERLSLFSTIAQFGSVQEVVASEIRIELMFPADDATANYFRRAVMAASSAD